MSNVKSFRFSDGTDYQLEMISEELNISEKEVIRIALDLLNEKLLDTEPDRLVVDFEPNLQGVNNPLVSRFIQQINDRTSFKTYMYEDGHKVSFKIEED